MKLTAGAAVVVLVVPVTSYFPAMVTGPNGLANCTAGPVTLEPVCRSCGPTRTRVLPGPPVNVPVQTAGRADFGWRNSVPPSTWMAPALSRAADSTRTVPVPATEDTRNVPALVKLAAAVWSASMTSVSGWAPSPGVPSTVQADRT